MHGFMIGDKNRGYDFAQVDRWTKLPLKCNYYTILCFVGSNHLYDWEAVDIKWWKRDLWGAIYGSW